MDTTKEDQTIPAPSAEEVAPATQAEPVKETAPATTAEPVKEAAPATKAEPVEDFTPADPAAHIFPTGRYVGVVQVPLPDTTEQDRILNAKKDKLNVDVCKVWFGFRFKETAYIKLRNMMEVEAWEDGSAGYQGCRLYLYRNEKGNAHFKINQCRECRDKDPEGNWKHPKKLEKAWDAMCRHAKKYYEL